MGKKEFIKLNSLWNIQTKYKRNGYLIWLTVLETPNGVENTIKQTAQMDGKSVSIRLPQDPGQAGKSQAKNFITMLSGFSVKAETVSGDKITRAQPFAAQVNIGNVKMLRGDWNKALIEELRNFPNGTHDDQVDGCSDYGIA